MISAIQNCPCQNFNVTTLMAYTLAELLSINLQLYRQPSKRALDIDLTKRFDVCGTI